MDDSMLAAVLTEVQAELAGLVAGLIEAGTLDVATAEQTVRAGVLAIGGRVLAAGLAARGTGKDGAHQACRCGDRAGFEGYRVKAVQTLVGWIDVRRAYYWCPACGRGQAPLDAILGLHRDSHSPGVRRVLGRLGAVLPFAQATATLAEVAGLQTSASTVRTVTEAIGCRREQELAQAVVTAWCDGLPPATGLAPARLYVAMDGVRVLGRGGEGKEAKVGVIAPEHYVASGAMSRASSSYVASFAPAAPFGQRLALEAHRRGAEIAAEVVVLGDGAESGAPWALEPGGRALSGSDADRRLVPCE